MPNVTRNSAKPALGAGANKASETASANQASQKAAPLRDDIEETEAAAAAKHIPGEVAKELAKLSALIVEKSDGQDKKLEEIRISTRATESKIADIADRIGEVENRLCFLEDEHERRKANPAATADEVAVLQQKLDDIENRERRNNLRFVGFPEGCEDKDAVHFLEETIPKIFNLDFPKGLEIERAHRIGAPPRRYDGDQPPRARALIARFLRVQDRNRIAEAARKLGDVSWEEHRVMVFADYSKLLSDKRAKFNECKKLLHNKQMRFSLVYPAVLVVKTPQGPRRFDDQKKALTFISSLD